MTSRRLFSTTTRPTAYPRVTIGPQDFAHVRASGVARLNHGSFGASPSAVLDAADAFRRDWARQPDAFYFGGRLNEHHHAATLAAARSLGCSEADAPQCVALVENATVAQTALARRWARLRTEQEHKSSHVMVLNWHYHTVSSCLQECARSGRLDDLPSSPNTPTAQIRHETELPPALGHCASQFAVSGRRHEGRHLVGDGGRLARAPTPIRAA